MSAITSRDAAWNSHTFSEVEAHIKARIGAITVTPVTANVQSSCSINTANDDGKIEIIIYTNSSGSDKTITIPTTYKTADGAALELTCKDGGYTEVNYLNIGGTIYARGA